MRKIILFIASSLDGFIARENDTVDWLFTDQEYGYKQFYSSIDTILIGRKTFEHSLTFGETYHGKEVFVFSKNKNAKNINNIHFEQDIIATTKNLLNKDGKNIWLVGGAEIITVMLNNDFINEIILSIHPLILGRGIPLFKEIVKEIKMTLIKEIRYETGLLQAHYQVQ